MATLTIVLPVSREEHLESVYTSLNNQDVSSWRDINLLVYVDGRHGLYVTARNCFTRLKEITTTVILRPESRGAAQGVKQRRVRIAKIHDEIQKLLTSPPDGFIFGKYLLLIEDDGILPRHTLLRMWEAHQIYPHAGLLTGLEAGRWGIEYIGVWQADDIYAPTKLETTTDITNGIEIDAAGLYCTLIPTLLYAKTPMGLFDNQLGPDINLGLSLRRLGYTNYQVPSIRLVHLSYKKQITVENRKKISLTKVGTQWQLDPIA